MYSELTSVSQRSAIIWPVLAAAYYAAAKARLEHPRGLPGIRKKASQAFTALLLLVSTAGFYNVWSVYATMHAAPATPVQSATRIVQPAAAVPAGLPRSAPTALTIPSIGLSTGLVGVGQNGDGSLEVPAADTVGWYTFSPTPGEIGPAILVGHVDDITGPAIFARLQELAIGDTADIVREDGRKVTFAVTKTAAYEADNFPSQEVYGNIDHAGIRLITCYGTFNQFTRQYSHNLVVYAKALE